MHLHGSVGTWWMAVEGGSVEASDHISATSIDSDCSSTILLGEASISSSTNGEQIVPVIVLCSTANHLAPYITPNLLINLKSGQRLVGAACLCFTWH